MKKKMKRNKIMNKKNKINKLNKEKEIKPNCQKQIKQNKK